MSEEKFTIRHLTKQELYAGVSGRTMLEMIGVLSITGVVTVGGLVGYSTVMNKQRANAVLEDAKLLSLLLLDTKSETIPSSFKPQSGKTFSVEQKKGSIDVTVQDIPEKVCLQLMKDVSYPLKTVTLTDGSETCLEGDQNLVFSFAYDKWLNSSFAPTPDPDPDPTPEPEEPTCPDVSAGDCTRLVIGSDGCMQEEAIINGLCRDTPNCYCSSTGAHPCADNQTVNSSLNGCDCIPPTGTTCLTPTYINGCPDKEKISCSGTKPVCGSDGQCEACPPPTSTSCLSETTDSNGCIVTEKVTCAANEVCGSSGQCVVNPCYNFVPTECVTACTNQNGTAVYTYASTTTPCDNDTGLCNGSGTCSPCVISGCDAASSSSGTCVCLDEVCGTTYGKCTAACPTSCTSTTGPTGPGTTGYTCENGSCWCILPGNYDYDCAQAGDICLPASYGNGQGVCTEDLKCRVDFSDYDKIHPGCWWCCAAGTQVALADGSLKNIEDVDYTNLLKVWDFDKGCFAEAYPLWIKMEQEADAYNLLCFDDGSELKTINQHRIFNKEIGAFTYPMTEDTPLGTTTFNVFGKEVKLIHKEIVREKVKYYNVITSKHLNCFTNGILTSCRLNNMYTIKDMKFVKNHGPVLSYRDFPLLPKEWIDGLRLLEQPADINHDHADFHGDLSVQDYALRLLSLDKRSLIKKRVA